MHHPQARRKKKRTSYGVRNVEIHRGNHGYGFTISGQQPCILSSIVAGSPASQAGLRSGDYLLSVNGHGVGKAPHDEVVKLIARSSGILRLQIAENFYSDSSDDEILNSIPRARSRPRIRPRSSPANDQHHPAQCRVAKVVRDLQSGAMFGRNPLSASTSSLPISNGRLSPSYMKWPTTPAPPPPPLPRKRDSEKIVHRAVLGYLGSIDIPRHLENTSMASLVRKCTRRIKTEGRTPTVVLLTIYVANIKLSSPQGRLIAEYPANRIIYCNSYSVEDKLHFGIFTRTIRDASNEPPINSCHVFKIQTKLIDHNVHANSRVTFGFNCTRPEESNNGCQEFPNNCEGVISAIQALYIADVSNEKVLFNERKNLRHIPSPQPSTISTSTVHSSNSDSGIGFKDDFCSHYDRYLNSEFSSRLSENNIDFSSLEREFKKPGRPKLTARAIASHRWSDLPRPFLSSSSTNVNIINNNLGDDIGEYVELASEENNKNSTESSPEVGRNSMNGGGAESVVSCPCVPSARNSSSSRCSPSTLAALSRSPRRYTSTLSVGTLAHNYYNNKRSRMQLSEISTFAIPDKLSPKVYTGFYPSPRGCSMENLTSANSCKSLLVTSFDDNDICRTVHQKVSNDQKSLPNNNTHQRQLEITPTRAWGSMQEIRKVDYLHGSNESCDKENNGVSSWALSFEKLLSDPKGLQTFAKFLRKEISHENIYFWAACERYADTEDVAARKSLAAQIYERHLSNSASEPVNVDSRATGQITQELLNAAPTDLFAQAQKQIFNLMKFDSYPRFLRSEIYQKCVESGDCIDDGASEDGDLFIKNSPSSKLKKSHSDAEDRSRKSILPWHRKNRSKSKDRGETEYTKKTPNRGETIYKSFSTIKRDTEGNTEDDSTSISSSRSSLASWDIALRHSLSKHSASFCEAQSKDKRELNASRCTGLCRVILPDGSTTVIPTTHSETVRDVIVRLLEKRALKFSNYDVLMLATDEIINLKNPSSVLASQEVEIVPTKTIKVELPSRRVINVVTHKGKNLKDILKPHLNKHGFKLDLVTVWADGHPISLDIPASNSPPRLTVTSNSKAEVDDAHLFKCPEDPPRGQSTLDEITNKVFEELRVGKSTTYHSEGSCKSDELKSESSSTLSGRFFSKESTLGRRKRSKSKSRSASEKNVSHRNDETSKSHTPLIAKWKNGVRLQLPSKFEGDDLYEGLKKAQKSRLEDQRGTELNFELPEFLKNKENGKYSDRKKTRQLKTRSALENCDISKFYDSEEDKPVSERCFDSTNSFEKTVIDTENTTIGNENGTEESENSDHNYSKVPSSPKFVKPPPLPPKPKSLLNNSLRSNGLPPRPFQRTVFDKKTI